MPIKLLGGFKVKFRIGIMVLSLLIAFPGVVSGLPPEQKSVLNSGSLYFNVETTKVCSGQTTPTGGFTGSWDPLTLVYPGIPIEQAVIESTKNYIAEKFPNSPFATNPQYVDQIFILSKARNVNPLLVMSIARQENGFGQGGSSAVRQNNYFGITQGNGYRSFPSVEAGIDYFVEKVGRHVSNPAGPYAGLTNFYEYLSIHQVGLIAYPGEYPEDAPGRNATPPYLTFDPRMDVYTSWDVTRNSHKAGNPVYNPGIYYKNSIKMITAITGIGLSDIPSKQPAGRVGCGAGAGIVNGDGYSFPLAPQMRINYNTLPCGSPEGCHHDGTPAFDLSYKNIEGASVYAIADGVIDRVNTQDPGWCQSIQLHATDGFYYWYGHVIDVMVTDGDSVKAGQEIAKVATWTEEHTCNGTSSGSHLHIDRGCTLNNLPQRGGSDSCRDPEFIKLLNVIYESLPVSGE